MELEYARHGITSLIGFFDVATGRMERPYLNPTRTEEDFPGVMRALIETDPEASWTFVCDGLNTHKSESLVRFIAQQCGLTEDIGSKEKSCILKSRAEFLHNKDHRIHIVYVPMHCSWMTQISIWFIQELCFGVYTKRIRWEGSYRIFRLLYAQNVFFVERSQ